MSQIGAAPDPDDHPTAAVTVAAVGDIVMGTDFPDSRLPPDDGASLFSEVKEIFRQADISFGNLEAPLCDGGVCTKDLAQSNVFAFRTPTRLAQNLKEAHLQALSLANNHADDFGFTGRNSTKKTLQAAGIKYSSKDGEVAEFTVKGLKVGIIAVSFGEPPRSLAFPHEALKEIGNLAPTYDILVVSVHGGAEGSRALHVSNQTEIFLGENRGNLVKFAHDAIDRGAALILGHGPHVPRALEVYKGRLIAYSLGNFATYKCMNLAGAGGYAPILWAELDRQGRFLRGRIHSFVQYPPGGPRKDDQHKSLQLMRDLSLQDFPASSPLILRSGLILPLPGQLKESRQELP
jgi:poly-gamma-glutamate capsule biosynthesis protein CapA/YwtB (metallophosphatase superfamily)